MNWCCHDIWDMVITVDRYLLTTISDAERLMNSYKEDPDDRVFLLRTFPARGHHSCWDQEAGLDFTLVSD